MLICLPSSRWRLSVMGTTFYVLWPIAYILIRVEYQVWWTWHVVFSFSFAHVVVCAVSFVRVIGNVTIFFFTNNFGSCKRIFLYYILLCFIGMLAMFVHIMFRRNIILRVSNYFKIIINLEKNYCYIINVRNKLPRC